MKVLITGSSKGLGASIARSFAANGYDIIINYNNSEQLALDLKKELSIYNVNVDIIRCDVSNEASVKEMFDNIDQIDVLINNAGIAIDNNYQDKTEDEFNKVLQTNLTSVFLVTKYALNKMNKGAIVNISSTNGIDTNYPLGMDYDASKAGVISLTHNYAAICAPNIRVNCICPGWINTPGTSDLSPEFKNKEVNKILLQRFSNPEEVAGAVYFAATNTYLCDSVIRVDGGVKRD